jgi:hypothetical protein
MQEQKQSHIFDHLQKAPGNVCEQVPDKNERENKSGGSDRMVHHFQNAK